MTACLLLASIIEKELKIGQLVSAFKNSHPTMLKGCSTHMHKILQKIVPMSSKWSVCNALKLELAVCRVRMR